MFQAVQPRSPRLEMVRIRALWMIEALSGYMIGDALLTHSAPEYFDVRAVRLNAADNERLRISNIRKLADTLVDYYEQVPKKLNSIRMSVFNTSIRY